jgi:hypothetical protein
MIPEKYNVVTGSHDVFVEYGNVGTKFSYIAPDSASASKPPMKPITNHFVALQI